MIITSWDQAGPGDLLATPRSGHDSFIWAGRLFVLGGMTGAAAGVVSASVQSSAVGNDTSFGPWRNENSLPAVTSSHTAITTPGGMVYVLGGQTTRGADVNTVYYANINGDGTLGRWKTGTPLPANLSNLDATWMPGGWLVVVGGMTNNVPVNTVYFAKVNSDGSLGAWKPGPVLPAAVAAHWVETREDWIYVVGGINSAALASNGAVYSNRFQPDGSFGQVWKQVSTLSVARHRHSICKLNNILWAIGGATAPGAATAITGTSTTFTNGSTNVTGVLTVFNTQLVVGDLIRPTGTTQWYVVQSITSATALVLTQPFQGTTVTGAGEKESCTVVNSVEFCRLMPEGAASGFLLTTPLSANLQAPLADAAALSDGFEWIYLVGGIQTNNNTQVNSIQIGGNAFIADGSI